MAIPFVHLHTHTDYSLLDGTQKCSAIAKKCKEFGMDYCVVTDHGTMSACMELTKVCKGEGIKPVYGCEFYVAPGKYTDKNNQLSHYKGYHLVCLAETYEGYINMCHLNEEAWIKGYYYNPRVDKDLLRQYSKGVICLSACLGGEVATMFLEDNDEGAEKAALEYREIFGEDNFFLEIQDHGLEEDKKANPKIIALARKHNIPLVATNDAHYLLREHAEAHEVFLCIGTQSTMTDPKHFKFPGGPEYYFKSPEEMEALFKDTPDALENTVKVAERCSNVHIPTVDEDKANHYPAYPLPPEYKGTREDYLLDLCREGMKERYDIDIDAKEFTPEQKVKVDRMYYELGIIKQTGFTSYYLVVWDFLHFARVDGVPLGPGRGSGAGSLVAYLIHITDIDPIRYNLLFERFLNPERVSPPDFDIDLCERRRHRVIEYVHERYGEGNVVQIGTFGTLKAKAVVKDVSRALGRSFSEGNQICKMIEADPKMTLKKAYDQSEDLRNFIKDQPWAQEVWHFSEILEGLNRNMSMHAAGVIICDTRVSNVCPISKGANDEPTTQFPAVPSESLGLLKMDFLGLRNLTIIQDALDLIYKNRGIKLTSSSIPEGDKAAYDLLNKGNTVAVFQLESSGMQNLCRRFGVSRLEDIIALIALFRPGPLQFLDEFIDRKSGKIKVEYDVPEMEPILKETYGIMLYQEQVMQVAQAVAGFSLGQADILRRAMGKKDVHKMEMMFTKFMDGAKAKGHDEKVIKAIWDKIYVFAGYGFNKSHSAAYGMLSYRTAYLKANFPAEFLAAVLTSELGNSDKTSFFLGECRKMGIKILPPDVNVCGAMFSVDGPNIRFGLAAIKGLGESAVAGIIKSREKDGPFKDISDFCERVEGNSKRLMENLIKAGAMDCFGLHRSQLLAMADDAIARAQSTAKDRNAGQLSLFDMFEDQSEFALKVPDIPEWPLGELLGYEKELLGFYVSGHPIGTFQDIVDNYQSHDLGELASLPKNSTVRVGAYISSVSIKVSKKDNRPWAILNLESGDAHIECFFFADSYGEMVDRYGKEIFSPDKVVFIDGETSQKDEDKPLSLNGRVIYSAEDMPSHFTKEMQINLDAKTTTDTQLQSLAELCANNPGKLPLGFFLRCDDGDVAILRNVAEGVRFSLDLAKRFREVVGRENVIVNIDRKPTPRPKRYYKHFDND